MKPPAVPSRQQRLQLAAQALALGLVLDPLRDADVRVLRQVHEQAPGKAHLRRQPRALGADRVLDHLHEQRLALVQDLLDRLVLAAVAVLPVLPDVGDVQERRALQPDLDERALHAGQHARHLAEVDVADEAARARALDVQLLHDRLLEHRDPRFLRRDVDEDLVHRAQPRRLPAGAAKAGRTPSRTLPPYSTGRPKRARICAVSASGSPITPEKLPSMRVMKAAARPWIA